MKKLNRMLAGCIGVLGCVFSAAIGACAGAYYGAHWIETHPADRIFPREMVEFGAYGFVLGPTLFAVGYNLLLWWLSLRDSGRKGRPMLRQLLQDSRISESDRTFDPSQLGDPIATRTEWTPLRGGGASFRTHKLIVVDSSRLEFRATTGFVLFAFTFLLAGVVLMIVFFTITVQLAFWFLLWGLIFACVGGCLLYFGTAPRVFDKRTGYFWKGRKARDEVFDETTLMYLGRLDEILALQIISEYCGGGRGPSYRSYELNLVLKDGTRMNVVDHGNLNKLRADAATLSAFLGKPVWDAVMIE